MDPVAMQVLQHVLAARRRGKNEVVELQGMDLRGANLLRADLVESDLSGAGLDHAQLAGAKLGRSKLQGTMFAGANLAGADLTEADLREANLKGARVEGASFAGADLRGASIEDVIGEPATVAGARIDKAMADRSRLRDDDIIQLWSEGIIIEDLPLFEDDVQTVCGIPGISSDAGPSARHVMELETEARRQRLTEDSSMPPSARVSQAMAEAAVAETKRRDRPLSLRSLRLVADILTPEMLAAPNFVEGDRVMGVTLQKKIGDGNVAVVYRAKTDDGEEVAVKLFKTHMTNQGLCLPSFRRGIQVMNRLTAKEVDGVVPLVAVSINRLAVLTPLAANGSAADLPALNWGITTIVEFVERLCAILQAAHEAGALHRCLKPSNVLLDADLNPFVNDFDVVDLPSFGGTAGVGGYAAYAPPEELLGQSTQSPTSDVYSLGRILAFLLLGEHPRATAEAVPLLDDIDAPEGLVRIIRRCTTRAPEHRYQTVADLVADLAKYEDAAAVGIGHDDDTSFMPAGVSGLPHRTRWLGQRERDSSPAAPPVRRSRTPPRPRGKKKPEPENAPMRNEQLLGAVGILAVLGSLLVVMLVSSPSERMVGQMQMLSAAGGALMTLMLPRTISGGNVLRLFLALLLGAALYFVNLPGFIVGS